MPDIKPGTDAIAKIQAEFAVAGFETTPASLQNLQHHCKVLLSFIQYCVDQIAVNTPKTGTNNIDWLEFSGFKYDLTAYSAGDKEAFKEIQNSVFQQELDGSGSGYKIVTFDLILIPASNPQRFQPSAFLSPVATRTVGGPAGTSTPSYPPK